MRDDDQAAPGDLESAIAGGGLGVLATRWALARRFAALDALFARAGADDVPLRVLVVAARAAHDVLTDDGAAARVEPRARALRSGARALERRCGAAPWLAAEREAIALAAALWVDARETETAARLYEQLGDDARAADLYQALGDIERMEACLARADETRGRTRAVDGARRRFETLCAAGERLLALDGLASVDNDAGSRALELHMAGQALARRLRPGNAVTLIDRAGTPLVVARAPAVIGRDADAAIRVREPSVSRRHARVVADANGFAIEDLGGHGGLTVGGARLPARWPLPDDVVVHVGERLSLRLRTHRDPRGGLDITGGDGLDRALAARVTTDAVTLAVDDAPVGLAIALGTRTPRLLVMSGARVRLNGQIIGTDVDLVAGDRIEIDGAAWDVT